MFLTNLTEINYQWIQGILNNTYGYATQFKHDVAGSLLRSKHHETDIYIKIISTSEHTLIMFTK